MTIPDEQEDQDVQIDQVNYRPSGLLRTLDRLASWFVDDRAYPNPDGKLRAKVFVLEHLFSPFLALAIAAMLYFGAGVATPSLYWLIWVFSCFLVIPSRSSGGVIPRSKRFLLGAVFAAGLFVDLLF